jgi:hypothetical protein
MELKMVFKTLGTGNGDANANLTVLENMSKVGQFLN